MSVTVSRTCAIELAVMTILVMLPRRRDAGTERSACQNRGRAGSDDHAGHGTGLGCRGAAGLGTGDRRRTVLVVVLGRADGLRQSRNVDVDGRAGRVDRPSTAGDDGNGAPAARAGDGGQGGGD